MDREIAFTGVVKLGSRTGSWPGRVLVTILSSSIKVISHTKPRRLHSMNRWLPCLLGHNRTRLMFQLFNIDALGTSRVLPSDSQWTFASWDRWKFLSAWLPRGAVSTHFEVRLLLYTYILYLLITCTSSGMPWGLRPNYWQTSLHETSLPVARLFIWSWCVNNFQMDWIWVPVNPTGRLPTQDPDCNLPYSSYIDDDHPSDKYNDFQSLIRYWWPEKVTSTLAFVT